MMGSGSALSHSFSSPATCTQQRRLGGVNRQTLLRSACHIALKGAEAKLNQSGIAMLCKGQASAAQIMVLAQPAWQEAHRCGVLDAHASKQGVPPKLESLAQHIGLPVRRVGGKEAGFCKRLLVLKFDQVGEGVSENWNVSATLTAVLQQ